MRRRATARHPSAKRRVRNLALHVGTYETGVMAERDWQGQGRTSLVTWAASEKDLRFSELPRSAPVYDALLLSRRANLRLGRNRAQERPERRERIGAVVELLQHGDTVLHAILLRRVPGVEGLDPAAALEQRAQVGELCRATAPACPRGRDVQARGRALTGEPSLLRSPCRPGILPHRAEMPDGGIRAVTTRLHLWQVVRGDRGMTGPEAWRPSEAA
jgi:hypothetical protein